MKKILVTENQLRKIKKFIKEERLRGYVFDWDDNILRMPTEIFLKDNQGNPVGMSTEEFANYRSDIGKNPFVYKGKTIVNFDSDPFRDFKNDQKFLIDVKNAIENKKFAPSYKKFIEALTYGNPFAINTARGHSPEALKKGVKIFIEKVLSNDQKEAMLNSIKKELPKNLTKGLNNNQLIDLYIDESGEFYPVSSEEFGKRFGVDVSGSGANPEHSKQIAIEHFVKKMIDGFKNHIVSGKYKKISLGFSDDDIKNVKAVEKFIDEQLKKMYPEVQFVVYNTSEGDKKKMVIQKN
jgi:hypothetical protein